MKKYFNLWATIFILSILILGGCGLKPSSPQIQTNEVGKIVFIIKIDPKITTDSDYPKLPAEILQKISINQVKTPKTSAQREIPAETDRIDLAVYNTSTGWSATTSISIIPGQIEYTATIDEIPVGSGYTVEAIAVDNDFYDYGLTVDKKNLSITSGTNTVSLNLGKLEVTDLSLSTTSIMWNQLFTMSARIKAPVDLYVSGVIALFVDYSGNLIYMYTPDAFGALFLAGTYQSVTMDNVTYYSLTGEPVSGTFSLEYLAVYYTQPVTDQLYGLVWLPSSPLTLQVVQPNDTGSLEIVIS